MRDKQFDHIIKNKLSGFVSPITPDWELFKAKKAIADAATSTTAFDTSVKETLEGHQSSTTPQWAAFQDFKSKFEGQESVEGQDQDFDTEIKSKLEGLESTTEPQWFAFQKFRAQAPSESEELFDKNIRVELEGYEATALPQWSAFQAFRIAQEATAADDNFDARIKDELEGYETTSEPNWQAFIDRKFDSTIDAIVRDYETSSEPQWDKFLEKKREKDGIIADASFDKSILGRLGQKQVRYNSEHWLLLKSRLQKIAYFRKQIFSYKTLEMIFVSLLLFSIGNHFHYLNSDNNIDLIMAEVQKTEAATIDLTQEKELETSITSSSNDKQIAGLTTENAELRTVESQEKNSLSTNSKPSNAAGTNFSSSITGGGGTSLVTSAVPSFDNTATTTTIAKESTNDKTDFVSPISARTSLAALDLLVNQKSTDQLVLIGSERALPETADARYINLNAKKKYRDEGSWFHILNSMDNNYITTPDNLETGLTEKTHEKFAYSGALLFSKARKNWEYEFGIGYAYLNYEPYDAGTITYVAQNRLREVDFSKMNLDLVQLPIRAKYHFVNNGRWSLFAGAGLSNEFIVKTRYQVDDLITGAVGQPTGQDPQPDELPAFYNREFTKGIFGEIPQLPSFVDYKEKTNNYILRGTLSLGAERNISDNFAVYIKTTYFHTLYNNHIGPYNDHINKMNFGMGFKLRIAN